MFRTVTRGCDTREARRRSGVGDAPGDAVADPTGCDAPGGALANRAAARLIQEGEAQAKTRLPGQRDGSVGKNDSEISEVIFGL
jgi:hypothetical protein